MRLLHRRPARPQGSVPAAASWRRCQAWGWAVQGQRGRRGRVGSIGTSGPRGPDGNDGIPGIAGQMGLYGLDAPDGSPGPKGVAGANAVKYPPGPKGAPLFEQSWSGWRGGMLGQVPGERRGRWARSARAAPTATTATGGPQARSASPASRGTREDWEKWANRVPRVPGATKASFALPSASVLFSTACWTCAALRVLRLSQGGRPPLHGAQTSVRIPAPASVATSRPLPSTPSLAFLPSVTTKDVLTLFCSRIVLRILCQRMRQPDRGDLDGNIHNKHTDMHLSNAIKAGIAWRRAPSVYVIHVHFRLQNSLPFPSGNAQPRHRGSAEAQKQMDKAALKHTVPGNTHPPLYDVVIQC